MKRRKRPPRAAKWALWLVCLSVITTHSQKIRASVANSMAPVELNDAVNSALHGGLDWGDVFSLLTAVVAIGITQLAIYIVHHPEQFAVVVWMLHDIEWLKSHLPWGKDDDDDPDEPTDSNKTHSDDVQQPTDDVKNDDPT